MKQKLMQEYASYVYFKGFTLLYWSTVTKCEVLTLKMGIASPSVTSI